MNIDMGNTAAPATPLPKLIRLEQQITSETDPVKRGCLRAERAGLLARQGSFDQARAALSALQTEFSRNPQVSVSIWMQVAEGWMAHYGGDLAASKDRLLRAYALSSAVGNTDLQALSSAWLAHLAYSQDAFTEMVKYLQICKTLARQDDHLSQMRMCLVLAQAYHFSNRFDLAQPWYLKARNHAMIEKDDAAISVLSYNMAGRRSFQLVCDSIHSGSTLIDSGLTMAGIQSSQSFDRLFKIPLLGSWVKIIQAMAHSAKSEYREALQLYQSHLDEAMKTRLSDQIAFFKADMAWCYVNLGSSDDATTFAQESRRLVEAKMYVEDKMITLGRLSQVYSALGMQEAKSFSEIGYTKSRCELEDTRREVLDLLSRLT